jgi:hypothetical protein
MDERHNAAIADMLDTHTPEIQELVQALRELIHAAAPELVEELKAGWGNIVYKHNGVVCAISPYSNHVNLNFYRGTSLPDPARVLEGTGRSLRHVKVRPNDELRTDALTRLIREAVALSESG